MPAPAAPRRTNRRESSGKDPLPAVVTRLTRSCRCHPSWHSLLLAGVLSAVRPEQQCPAFPRHADRRRLPAEPRQATARQRPDFPRGQAADRRPGVIVRPYCHAQHSVLNYWQIAAARVVTRSL
jgi:hypothetical protein